MKRYGFSSVQDLLILQDELNKFFKEAEGLFNIEEEKKWEHSYFFEPIMDAVEYEDKYVFFVELPGISLNNVEIHLDGSSLIISGKNPYPIEEEGSEVFLRSECHYGDFRRIIRIDKPFWEDKIDATLRDGVLKIVVPKKI